MNTKNEIQDIILKTIEYIVDRKIEKSGYIRLKQGQINEVLGNNKYNVKVLGTVKTVPCCINQTFSKGDTVYLLLANGKINDNDMVIIGKVVT